MSGAYAPAVAPREIPGRGVGLVATRDIAAGECVLRERATVCGTSVAFRIPHARGASRSPRQPAPPFHVRHLRARQAVRRGHVRVERRAARRGGVPRRGPREGPPRRGRRASSASSPRARICGANIRRRRSRNCARSPRCVPRSGQTARASRAASSRRRDGYTPFWKRPSRER